MRHERLIERRDHPRQSTTLHRARATNQHTTTEKRRQQPEDESDQSKASTCSDNGSHDGTDLKSILKKDEGEKQTEIATERRGKKSQTDKRREISMESLRYRRDVRQTEKEGRRKAAMSNTRREIKSNERSLSIGRRGHTLWNSGASNIRIASQSETRKNKKA
jgi:hypothetical protein